MQGEPPSLADRPASLARHLLVWRHPTLPSVTIGDPEMIRLRKLARVAKEELGFDPRRAGILVVSTILPQNSFNRVRTLLLRALGLRIGPTGHVAGSLRITGSGPLADRLSIGPGGHITGPLHIDLTAPVRIGSRVYMGYDVMLITADHEIADPIQRCGRRVYRAVHVEDGAWLGSRVVVLPGVRIGRGAVVGAGSVVTRDVPPHTLVGGVPARFIRDLGEGGAEAPVGRERRAPPVAAAARH
ncbi:MAG: acyltransferase [Polyangiaceae bacterium]